ncbi:MAG: 50S ribosomal protein L22 [Candidatus Omnitrophota bacterium]|jgi:large subunit ribosomal protein L22
MVTRAVLRYLRVTPRKFRLIIPLVKGKRVNEALAILYTVKKGASKYCIDLLNSAMANAKRIQGVDVANLYISNLVASGGPVLKRFRAASMGRASTIRKRTSHITLELSELAASQAVPKTKPGAGEIKKPNKKTPEMHKAKPTEKHAVKKNIKRAKE